MIVMCFDRLEKRLADCATVSSLVCKQTVDENTCLLRGFMIPEATHYIAFKDINNALRLYEIKERSDSVITDETTLYCESSLYELGLEEIKVNFNRVNASVNEVATAILQGTRWTLGQGTSRLIAELSAEFATPLELLSGMASVAGVYFLDRIEHDDSSITNRYIDIYPIDLHPQRGKRYELGKDILDAKFIVDNRNVVTAIYPIGKEVGDKDNKQKLTLVDYIPDSLPAGYFKFPARGYIENALATGQYGIAGHRPRFAKKQYNAETQEALYILALADLVRLSQPLLRGSVNTVDLERLGFAHEAVRLNDEVAFICGEQRYYANVIAIEREYAQVGQDKISFGQAKDSLQRAVYNAQRTADFAKELAESNRVLDQLPDGLIEGYIDTAKTRILSTNTNRSTDTDGGDLYINDEGTKAIKITGNGILCADNKVGDNWQWRTAIEGSGVVTQMLTAGVIQAALVRIVGSEHFLWDAENIIIKNPSNINELIRIGRYNGTDYGIGFSKDGGSTWLNAMDFNGLQSKIEGNGIKIDQSGIEMTGKKLNVQAGTYGDANYFELNALLGWMRAGHWTFDNYGARFNQSGEGFSLSKHLNAAKLTSSNLHLTVGADYDHSLDLTGSYILFTVDSLNTSILMGKVVDGYTYNDICLVCSEAGNTWNTAAGNIGTTSNRWDILWCDTIHYRQLSSSSSRKVKHAIEPLENTGDIVDKLSPVSFVYNWDEDDKKQFGLIYEDTIEVLPEICIPAESEQDIDAIDYTKVIPILLSEIKDLRKRVKELEDRG